MPLDCCKSNVYTQFNKIIKKVNNIECRDVFVPYKTNGSAQKIHRGGKSILNDVKDNLSCLVLFLKLNTLASKSAPEWCDRKQVDCFLSLGIS